MTPDLNNDGRVSLPEGAAVGDWMAGGNGLGGTRPPDKERGGCGCSPGCFLVLCLVAGIVVGLLLF